MTSPYPSRCQELYEKHLTALRLQGKAKRTRDSYARAVRRIIERFGVCPDELTTDQVRAHFNNLIDTHSWSTVKVDLCGLKFFFEQVLAQPFPWLGLVKPPTVKNLPDILTTDEIARLILATRECRFQTFWLVTYSLGLRLSETLHLTIGNIDAQRAVVHVRDGKGRKDRFVLLPTLCLLALRRYWITHRHPRLIFPGRPALDGGPAPAPMDRSTTQRAFARVVADCRIHKSVSIHSLRRAYATHLIEAGLSLTSVRDQLGHASVQTTVRYVPVTDTDRAHSRDLTNDLVCRLCDCIRQRRPS